MGAQLPARLRGKSHRVVDDAAPEGGGQDAVGDAQDGGGQDVGPGWVHLIVSLLVPALQTRYLQPAMRTSDM